MISGLLHRKASSRAVFEVCWQNMQFMNILQQLRLSILQMECLISHCKDNYFNGKGYCISCCADNDNATWKETLCLL